MMLKFRLPLVVLILLMVTATIAPAADTSNLLPNISSDLSLADAVAAGLKHNPMAQAAGYQTQATQARIGMARAMTRPQLAGTVFAGNSTMGDIITSPPGVMPSSVFLVPDRTAATGQVGLMIPLYTGGRLTGSVKSAQAMNAATASDRASIERSVALEVKAAYHRALLAQATVDVYSNLVKEERERVRIAELTFSEGKIAKYDLLRNQAGLAESQQQLTNARRDATIAAVELKAAMGVSQDSDVTLTDKLAYVPVSDTLETYSALAMKNRPELAAARARISSAESTVGVAKSAYRPQVYGNAMQGLSVGLGGTESGFTVGVTIGLPILDGGLRRAAVDEAQAMLGVMRLDEKQALLAVQQDVNTVWAELQAADTNVKLSEAAVTQADEDYRVIRLRYEAGKSINVEVLDALAALVGAQNNRLMALYEHSIARDRLARAIGEL